MATLIEKIAEPVSSGSLRLASTDVKLNPIVRFKYFNNPVDVERCVNGTRKIGDVLRSRALNDFKFRNWLGDQDFRFVGPALPIDQTNYVKMADFCRRTVSTIWHYHTMGAAWWGGWLIVILGSLELVHFVLWMDQCLVYHQEPILRPP